jgi:hypothetical protein
VVQRALSPTVDAPFASLNAAVVAQLSNLPVSSPASGTRYEFDRKLGVYVPFPQSLGPILSERAETIGKGRFFFSVAYQHFRFDRADSLDLRSFNVVVLIPLEGIPGLPAGASGATTARTYIGLDISQTTAYFTYGLGHWLDVSLATPLVSSSMTVRSQGSVDLPLLGVAVDVPAQTVHASATGIGDQLVRIKAQALSRGLRLAAAADVRLPTGDEFNFHGAGAYGFRPFGIASMSIGAVSPHVNAGYDWNGASLLADPEGIDDPQGLPERVFYVVGMDAALSDRFTLAVDFLDQVALNRFRSLLPGTGGSRQPKPIGFERVSTHERSLAVGFKARLFGQTMITGNALLRMNEEGLRAQVVPNLAISRSF